MFGINLFNLTIFDFGGIFCFAKCHKWKRTLQSLTAHEKKVIRTIYEWDVPYVAEITPVLEHLDVLGLIYPDEYIVNSPGVKEFVWKLAPEVRRLLSKNLDLMMSFPESEPAPAF